MHREDKKGESTGHMPYPAIVVDVLVASPGDVKAERILARDII